MVKLKIFSDIVDEETRLFYEWFELGSAVSFDSIDKFIESIPEDETELTIEIKSWGGFVVEGIAIYGALRQLDKEITTILVGDTASMATVIMLAAPQERRFARQGVRMLIHEPSISYVGGKADELRKYADSLDATKDNILDIYVERTGADRKVLEDLMKEDKFINLDKAQELNFISKVQPHISANYKPLNIQNKMTKKVENKKQGWWASFVNSAKKLGKQVVCMDLVAADGTEISIDRQDGDPEVNDSATPNGSFVMPNGSTITIENEKITNISKEEDKDNQELQTAKVKITELEKDLADSKTKIAELEAKQISDSQKEILNMVNVAGGSNWLKKQTSNVDPKPNGKNAEDVVLNSGDQAADLLAMAQADGMM